MHERFKSMSWPFLRKPQGCMFISAVKRNKHLQGQKRLQKQSNYPLPDVCMANHFISNLFAGPLSALTAVISGSFCIYTNETR